MAEHKLFGTDGIRARFGEWPLTEEMIYCLGRAASIWLKKKSVKTKKLSVIIGKDTRASCNVIEQNLANGFKDEKIEVYSAGVIPTPGLAYMTNVQDVKLGAMISASHNPAEDNGIKFFSHNGFKLSEKEEIEIENIVSNLLKRPGALKSTQKRKHIKLKKIPPRCYIEHLKKSVSGLNLFGLKMVADCANGAVSAYAQKLFEGLGAKVDVFNNKPDGKNINYNCGSLHPEQMAVIAKRKKAVFGCSFDGDADRVMFCDEQGKIIDGDFLMALVAKYLQGKGTLSNNTVVGTSMTNFGLEKYLEKLDIKLVRADVGDKYVLKEMLKHKSNFGGEQSGHIIFLEYATTGDGMLTALQLLKIMKETGQKLSHLSKGLKKYPQLIKNVRVSQKKDFRKMPVVWERIKYAEKVLKDNGRLVMRYSGTECLARIMVEGMKKQQIKNIADYIAEAIQKEIGV
ncbi:MAG: phosphoglucosamine mutase [Candidatus Omnitrophica bacterium]|nr:phosphoglucosamine mutase [Candidatus Omnitrophota bacterium]